MHLKSPSVKIQCLFSGFSHFSVSSRNNPNVNVKDLQLPVHLVRVNEASSGRIDGSMYLLSDDTERGTVMITDGRHRKEDENS